MKRRDFDQESDLARVTPPVLAMAKYPAAGKSKGAKVAALVHQRQRETMSVLREEVAAFL